MLASSLHNAELRAQYILMQRIRPPAVDTAVLRDGSYVIAKASSELGIFGSMLSDSVRVHSNDCCGHLLRTKQQGVNEGGVAAGFAVIDSPILT